MNPVQHDAPERLAAGLQLFTDILEAARTSCREIKPLLPQGRHAAADDYSLKLVGVQQCAMCLPAVNHVPCESDAGMPQPNITHHWNWWACGAYAAMWAALVFYFYVRIRCGEHSLMTKISRPAYQIFSDVTIDTARS